MAQIVLADEINRATPKTQSALLEAMEETQITIDGATYRLPEPFMVMATQNPIEYEGTFPLPEAQLDRFMMNIKLGYPKVSDEMNILDTHQFHHPLDDLEQIMGAEELLVIQKQVKSVHVDPSIREYIVAIANATRNHNNIYLGFSPRGSLALYRTSQALAAIRGRGYVIPDDVKLLTKPTLAHRIIITPAARVRAITSRLFWMKFYRVCLCPEHGSVVERGADLCDPGKLFYLFLCLLSLLSAVVGGYFICLPMSCLYYSSYHGSGHAIACVKWFSGAPPALDEFRLAKPLMSDSCWTI